MIGHAPVLLDEVVEQLAISGGGIYVDATFGRGGHSEAILASLGPDGRLFAMDRDPAARDAARALAARDSRFTFEQENFGRLGNFLDNQQINGQIDGLLIDLGVSSPQLDDAGRGFSFMADGPLDMRMNPEQGVSAADWLNAASEGEIARVIARYGEERAARRIARAISTQREQQPLATTGELAALIERVVRRKPGGKHPATRTFQAIRLYVNDELAELDAVLPQALDALAPGGRLCIISFHSLEDRRVKRFMRDHSRVDPALARLPIIPESARPRLRLPTRAIRAGAAELERNPRARSATLRVAERC